MPLCLGASGSVRATSMPRSAMWASVFHTFCPVMTHSSPSRTALARQAGQVGAGARLAEQLAPGVLAGEHRGAAGARLQLVVAVGDDGRPGHGEPEERAGVGRRAPCASRRRRSTSRWRSAARRAHPSPRGSAPTPGRGRTGGRGTRRGRSWRGRARPAAGRGARRSRVAWSVTVGSYGPAACPAASSSGANIPVVGSDNRPPVS